MPESTRQHWDRFWEEHVDIDDVYSNEDRLLDPLRRMEPAGKLIMEVGAGSGRDAIELARMGGKVIVLDYSRPSLSTARGVASRAGADILYVCGDALQLPFRDGSIDIVFHQGLLEHFRDPMPLLQENARVVSDGGYLLVDVPQTFHMYTLIKKTLIACNRWFAGWETQFTIEQLEGLVRRTGLEVAWSYGDWMVPGVFYRGVRSVLRKYGWLLPKYPRGIWPFNVLSARMRETLRGSWIAFHTYAMIGTVGRRKGRGR